MGTNTDSAKKNTGEAAAAHVESGMRVGLGTGSTVNYTIRALGSRGLDIVCTSTSDRTQKLAEEVGLRAVAPDELGALDIAIDGADEVDPGLNLIKGGGGAHTREKIVAAMAARFIVVVDEAKLVERLGAFKVPIEALPFAPDVVAAGVRALGAGAVTRRETGSDNGNALLDADFGLIDDPAALAAQLSSVPGLIEHGIFLSDMVERVIVGKHDGVREITR